MALKAEIAVIYQGNDIVEAIRGATFTAFKEGAGMLALEAQQRVSLHSQTYETMRGIKAGTVGRKVFVETEWPGLVVDRPHKMNQPTMAKDAKGRFHHATSKVSKKTRGKGLEVPGLYYMEDAFDARREDLIKILLDKTDTAARRQVARIPRFTNKGWREKPNNS